MISCPNCNGNLKFDIELQKLHCSFCNDSFDPYAFDAKDQDGIENKSYDTTIFTCPECAGEIQSTDVDVTGFCPFCGASTIFYSRLSKELKPDYIIPFSKTKEDCKRLYMEKAKGAIFLPKAYKDPKYIDGFRGIYMPYWAYNVTQNKSLSLEGEDSHRKGDYIIHKFYNLTGKLDAFYNGLSYDASSSFADDISEKIAPFNVKEKKEFTAGFLSGFYADTADVDSEVYEQEAMRFAINESARELGNVEEYSSLTINNLSEENFDTKVTSVERTMYPVWFMSYRHNNRVAYATVNGQTGKVSADFPIDVSKYLLFSAGVALGLFIILNLFLTLKPTTTSLLTGIIGVIALIIYWVESNALKDRNNHSSDKGFMFLKKSNENNSGDNSKVADNKEKAANANKSETKKKGTGFITLIGIIGTILPFLSWLSGTIHDEIHYCISAGASVAIAILLINVMRNFNEASTRPLPQFQKKGGDDRA